MGMAFAFIIFWKYIEGDYEFAKSPCMCNTHAFIILTFFLLNKSISDCVPVRALDVDYTENSQTEW